MNEKEIRSFSLESLLEMCGRRPGDFYYDGCLITSRVNTGDEVPMDLFRYPVRIDAFAVVFCSKGSISLLSNLTRYELGENSFFVHLPGSILHVESTPDAEIYVAACEEEFIRRIDVDIKLLSNLFLQLERYPLLQLEPGECLASWEFHCFSTASAAFHKVLRSAYDRGAFAGSRISLWTIPRFSG